MLLLVTGCIKVDKSMPYVTITSQNDRLEAYCETIRWAIEDTFFDKVVFCENSEFSFDYSTYEELAKKNNKYFEYLTFKGDTITSSKKGKGYGEGEIVLFALNNSELLKDEKSFCKITGRLKVSNVNKLIKSNSKNYFMNKRLLNEVDTRFYCIQKDIFLKFLKNSHVNVDDFNNYYLEHAYYDSLVKENVKYRTFYERPLFVGIAGSTGRVYADKKNKSEFITTFLFKTNIFNNKFYWKMRAKLKNLLIRK